MASDIFEENIELEIGLLEAGPVTRDSYPYPSLAVLGKTEKRSFRAAILENAYLRATFLPGLGGRLWSLFDKRTQTELLASDPLIPVAGGRRGARLSCGLQLHLDGEERLTSLAAVQFAGEEADEEGQAGLWLSEAVTGTGLSWHLHVTLPPDRAELRMEARIFNRNWEDIPYRGGLLLPALSECLTDGGAFFTVSDGAGPGFLPERGRWSAWRDGDSLFLSRLDRPRLLAPRQLDTWSISIIPISGLGRVSSVSRSGALGIEGSSLRIQATEPLTQHKVVLLTESGQSLEAPLEAFPERVADFSLPEPISGAAVLDSGKQVVLRWEGGWTEIGPNTASNTPAQPRPPIDDLEAATFDISTRHYAHALLGNAALAARDLDEADARYEQALLYNAEDHLTWWMKAVGRRLASSDSEESAELLNAHYLAPLEPALRAESFLRSPRVMDREPTALLRPMAEFPEFFIEVASHLIEARLFEEAARWIDEALRHVDLPMLHYFLAYSHVESSGLELEAAEHVAAAAIAPLAPPFPWRPIEIKVLETLSTRFATDERLRQLVKLTAIRRA